MLFFANFNIKTIFLKDIDCIVVPNISNEKDIIETKEILG